MPHLWKLSFYLSCSPRETNSSCKSLQTVLNSKVPTLEMHGNHGGKEQGENCTQRHFHRFVLPPDEVHGPPPTVQAFFSREAFEMIPSYNSPNLQFLYVMFIFTSGWHLLLDCCEVLASNYKSTFYELQAAKPQNL